ncbi:hypothetical protein BDZ97DRAFT_1846393 [Flammula alnicola]|nr:hypothetical protein BDZ97DRAFT_1846393 [Flammula alnicola]
MSGTLRKSTTLDYRLPPTVESIQQGWLNTCQGSARIVSALYLVINISRVCSRSWQPCCWASWNSDNLDAGRHNSRGGLLALEITGYASVFLNISACISSFILADRLGDVPYRAARDSSVPLGGQAAMEQQSILRKYGIGALWQWIVWHCQSLGCLLYVGAWCIFAQLLTYIWLQESKETRIVISILVGFCILPFSVGQLPRISPVLPPASPASTQHMRFPDSKRFPSMVTSHYGR